MQNPFQTIDNRLDKLESMLINLKEGIDNLKSSINNGSSTANRKEAAKYLGISESTIRRIEESGAIKTIRMGASVRFDWNHLDEYKESHTK